jgi:hypothetical protein
MLQPANSPIWPVTPSYNKWHHLGLVACLPQEFVLYPCSATGCFGLTSPALVPSDLLIQPLPLGNHFLSCMCHLIRDWLVLLYTWSSASWTLQTRYLGTEVKFSHSSVSPVLDTLEELVQHLSWIVGRKPQLSLERHLCWMPWVDLPHASFLEM